MNEYAQRLLELMKASDRIKANALIDELILLPMTAAEIMHSVLDPALVQIGIQWGKETASLAQTFVAAKIAEDILLRCTPEKKEDEIARFPVVIGNIEDDFHSLGRRIISSFLTAAGWEVHDLGNDVLPQTFIDEALRTGASVIGVSAMMQTTALNIQKLHDLLVEQNLTNKIKLAVGGAVFNWRPQLVDEVGADGTASNAAEVDALFRKLKAKTEGQS